MTLDETIKHCIEAAAKNKRLASEIGEQLIGTPFEKYTIECQERAAKYNQFAEWLTELKQWKENPFEVIDDYCSKIDDCVECDFIDCCPNRACK